MHTAYTAKVMSRFMSPEELEEFEKKYIEALSRTSTLKRYIPSEEHYLFYKKWLADEMDSTQLAAAMGCSKSTVLGRMALINKIMAKV